MILLFGWLKTYLVIGAALMALAGAWQVRSCQVDKLKSEKVVAEKTVEVERAKEEARKKVETMEPRDIVDYWRGMHK